MICLQWEHETSKVSQGKLRGDPPACESPINSYVILDSGFGNHFTSGNTSAGIPIVLKKLRRFMIIDIDNLGVPVEDITKDGLDIALPLSKDYLISLGLSW